MSGSRRVLAYYRTVPEYTARHLSVLEGLEAVRKRPGMYIGSTDSRGLMHCLWEIIDNAVDEALDGHADRIGVTLLPDGSVAVADNGRGIPVDEVPGVGLSGVEVVYTKLHAGGKFGGGSYAASGGLHGVGASVVNALSQRLDVEVDRDGRTHRMTFRRGEPGRFADGRTPSPESEFTPFVTDSELEIAGKVAKKKTGTRVRFWPDPQIFPSTTEMSIEAILGRAKQTAFLVPGLTIVIRDERTSDTLEETFHYDGGVVDFVDDLAPDAAITQTFHIEGSGTFVETVQTLDKDTGHLVPIETERTCRVDVALSWGQGYETTMKSFVNIIATPVGGTHVQGFEAGLSRAMRKLIETNARRLKITAKDPKIEKEDIMAGLTAVVTVSLPEPQFEGQTKEILGTGPVRGIVNKVIGDGLLEVLSSTKRSQRDETNRLLEKIVAEMRARVAARMHKEISRRKNALETSTMPAKLSDCRSEAVENTELFIVEGDSALGTAKLARNSEFQALLPIRGKILNVQKASPADILRNQEVAAIIQVVGAGSGRTFDVDAARYGKVILMTDADVDGAHIRTLLLTLFFRYMRPLVEAGRVYAAVPPLHRIDVIGRGKAKNEVHYTYSEAELSALLKKLEKQGRRYKEPIQRYKGLGEMDADQLAETTMDPEFRTLRRVSMADEEAIRQAETVFELLMGNDVAPRKEFIVEGSEEVDRARIDV
ncbi:DNA gyrase/topoisomerase IV subunit B [Flaviflexus equikiangi]|uniref:DNA topoisomerase (ATP-hydrolyzing) n=1 Tax=Flaviflexus equikiangi TaxID=2758573 RepID=A0ABS2TG17_9ACTO|nr:type IIA DNA topoisomerase subunit B [Flaviflexus equikiangi]